MNKPPPDVANLKPQAIGRLGVSYWHGWGVPQDYVMAVDHFWVGAAGGDPDCEFWLGVAMAEGRGRPKDVAEARRHLKKAKAKGHAAAKDYLKTLDLREKAAGSGKSGAVTGFLIAAVGGAAAGLVAAFGFQEPPTICAAAFAGGFVIVGGLLWLMRPEPNTQAAALAAVAEQQVHGAKNYDEGTI